MTINSTIFDNITGLGSLATALDTNSNGVFMGLLVFTLWVVAFISLTAWNNSPKNALTGSSLFTMVMSIILALGGFMTSGKVLIIVLSLTTIGLFASIVWRD